MCNADGPKALFRRSLRPSAPKAFFIGIYLIYFNTFAMIFQDSYKNFCNKLVKI